MLSLQTGNVAANYVGLLLFFDLGKVAGQAVRFDRKEYYKPSKPTNPGGRNQKNGGCVSSMLSEAGETFALTAQLETGFSIVVGRQNRPSRNEPNYF